MIVHFCTRFHFKTIFRLSIDGIVSVLSHCCGTGDGTVCHSLCSPGLFGPLRSQVALFVVFLCFFSLLCPRCLCPCVFSGPGCPGGWRLVVFAPSPPFFCPFPSLPPPPPALFCLFFFIFSLPLLLFVCLLLFFLPWCAGSAVFGLVCVSCAVGCACVCCCGPCAPVGAVLRLCCVVGCSLVVPVLCVLLPVLRRCHGVFCVLSGAVWHACVGLGSFPVLLPPVAVAWSPVEARGGFPSWGAVLRCSGGRLSCDVVLSASCLAGGAVLFRSRRLVLCIVACGCRLFVAGSACLLFFSAGVCCPGCSCLAAWLAALLCAVVCCDAPLPCGVSCVLWCFVAVWCRAVPPCCPSSFAGGVGLCPFPVCAVLCCAARRVVRCRFGLRCCWCLVLWCVAVCCGVSLAALWLGGAALVCRGLLLCRAVFCGAVLLGCAVCCVLLRLFLFPLKTMFWFLKIKVK